VYSKKETSLLREQFWTAFGLYMAPVLSAEGEKINWINYKTGQKDIRFVMQVDTTAYIAIEFSHKDAELQDLQFEKLLQFKKIIELTLEEEWKWERKVILADGRIISRMFYELENVTIMNKNDWPQLISFFKQRIIALDTFWSEYKFAFEN
jgi:hypothetical protein